MGLRSVIQTAYLRSCSSRPRSGSGLAAAFGTHYDELRVKSSASQQEIKQAYAKRLKEVHPDLNQNSKESNEATRQLTRAYEVLVNPHTRLEYDRQTAFQASSTSTRGDFEAPRRGPDATSRPKSAGTEGVFKGKASSKSAKDSADEYAANFVHVQASQRRKMPGALDESGAAWLAMFCVGLVGWSLVAGRDAGVSEHELLKKSQKQSRAENKSASAGSGQSPTGAASNSSRHSSGVETGSARWPGPPSAPAAQPPVSSSGAEGDFAPAEPKQQPAVDYFAEDHDEYMYWRGSRLIPRVNGEPLSEELAIEQEKWLYCVHNFRLMSKQVQQDYYESRAISICAPNLPGVQAASPDYEEGLVLALMTVCNFTNPRRVNLDKIKHELSRYNIPYELYMAYDRNRYKGFEKYYERFPMYHTNEWRKKKRARWAARNARKKKAKGKKSPPSTA